MAIKGALFVFSPQLNHLKQDISKKTIKFASWNIKDINLKQL